MNELIKSLLDRAEYQVGKQYGPDWEVYVEPSLEQILQKFAELIVKECIDKIETYRIPVGNSAAGEMACEWTYDALKEIRGEIKRHFGVEE
jgi:hypothetical protein